MIKINESIIFFDGECNICNRLVRFVIKRSNNFHVYPLRSDIAKNILKQNHAGILLLNTLVLLENKTTYYKSDAVLRIFRKMHGLWPVLTIFKFIPLPIRNKLYDIFAKNRRRWFGAGENCMLDTNLNT
jgi:predicted DCC family thiol-disulfide oxidoreductase YuxK